MDRLVAYGVGIDVPAGWEVELSVQEDPATIDLELAFSESPLVVMHVGNFWMPADHRSDYGVETTERMGPNGIFISLIEFDTASAGSRLFSSVGIPVPLYPDDFTSDQLQRPMRDQAGLQRFFRSGSRAFCLHTVIGSHSLRGVLTPEVNRILSGLTIE